MIQRDVLMRQIHQLADAIVRIVEHVTNREYDDALTAVDEILDTELDGSAEGLRTMPPERLLNVCHDGGRFSAQAAQTLAKILRLQGDAHAGRGEATEAGQCYGRALLLLRAALNADDAEVSWQIGTHVADLQRLVDDHPTDEAIAPALDDLE
jgi:hypothetical protein